MVNTTGRGLSNFTSIRQHIEIDQLSGVVTHCQVNVFYIVLMKIICFLSRYFDVIPPFAFKLWMDRSCKDIKVLKAIIDASHSRMPRRFRHNSRVGYHGRVGYRGRTGYRGRVGYHRRNRTSMYSPYSGGYSMDRYGVGRHRPYPWMRDLEEMAASSRRRRERVARQREDSEERRPRSVGIKLDSIDGMKIEGKMDHAFHVFSIDFSKIMKFWGPGRLMIKKQYRNIWFPCWNAFPFILLNMRKENAFLKVFLVTFNCDNFTKEHIVLILFMHF